jgi:hypothetical protein
MPEFYDQQSGRCSDGPFSTSGPPLQDSPRPSSMIPIPAHVTTIAPSPPAARLMSQPARSTMYRATQGPQRSSSTGAGRAPTTIRNAHPINATHGATPRPSPPRNATKDGPQPTSHPQTPGRILGSARMTAARATGVVTTDGRHADDLRSLRDLGCDSVTKVLKGHGCLA